MNGGFPILMHFHSDHCIALVCFQCDIAQVVEMIISLIITS